VFDQQPQSFSAETPHSPSLSTNALQCASRFHIWINATCVHTFGDISRLEEGGPLTLINMNHDTIVHVRNDHSRQLPYVRLWPNFLVHASSSPATARCRLPCAPQGHRLSLQACACTGTPGERVAWRRFEPVGHDVVMIACGKRANSALTAHDHGSTAKLVPAFGSQPDREGPRMLMALLVMPRYRR
jgi:hypothetical protein